MKRLLCLLGLVLLVGCSDEEHADLQQWMAENSSGLKAAVPRLPEVKPYEPVPYTGGDQPDPFRASKIEPDNRGRQGTGKGALQPDFAAREARNSLLEKYPLESLRMVGFLNINNRANAVIQVENKVRLVKVGEYMGLDFGVVTSVTGTEVKLKELIQDSAGDWSERESVLLLQGREESKP